MSAEKWVTFDCFGTLIDWQTGFRRTLASVAGSRVNELVDAYHKAEADTQDEDKGRSYKDVLTTTLRKAADFDQPAADWRASRGAGHSMGFAADFPGHATCAARDASGWLEGRTPDQLRQRSLRQNPSHFRGPGRHGHHLG